MQPNNRRFVGIAALIFVNLIWAGSFSATAIAVTKMSPVFLTLVRLGTGALVLCPFLRLPKNTRWDGRTIVLSIILGIIGFSLPVSLETTGLKLSTPAMAAISIAMEPLFTVVIATLMLRERLTPIRIGALVLALFGAWMNAGFPRPGAPGYIVGDILLILAVLCYAIYSVFSVRLIRMIPATSAAAITLLTGFLGTVPIWLCTGATLPSTMNSSVWISVLYLALGSTAGAYLLWQLILKWFHVSFAALFLYLQPIFGVILSVLIVGTRPPIYFYGGSVLILLAIYLGREKKRDSVVRESPT